MDADGFRAWLDAYFAAWVSNDPDEVAALFSEDARYWTGPFVEPWVGRDVITKRWTGGGKEDVEHSSEVLGVEGDVGVAHWSVRTRGPGAAVIVEMDGILVITFDEQGRCREHREWFASRERPDV
jgi:uncharacterized protein (TIGR02246 family)